MHAVSSVVDDRLAGPEQRLALALAPRRWARLRAGPRAPSGCTGSN